PEKHSGTSSSPIDFDKELQEAHEAHQRVRDTFHRTEHRLDVQFDSERENADSEATEEPAP
ncbi:MAG: hypothetical protein KDA85_08035, partial [Planctomycetaceae bacterium]|nr:hypothetical protein [Planctomycetaceae bacterium]